MPIIRRTEPVIAMSATAAVVLMATPTAWSHHWVWVVPALIGIGAHALRYRSAGWAVVGVVIAAIFYVAPFRWMPNVWGVEMKWSLWEQVLGASYVIPAALTLGLGCWYVTRGRGVPAVRGRRVRNGRASAPDPPVGPGARRPATMARVTGARLL